MMSVLKRKFRTLLRDPRQAIASQFVRGNKQRAIDYLRREGVEELLRAGETTEIPPHVVDLWQLHHQIRRRRPQVVLEFGVGFSTLVMAHALMRNAAKDETPGHLWSIDTSEPLDRQHARQARTGSGALGYPVPWPRGCLRDQR